LLFRLAITVFVIHISLSSILLDTVCHLPFLFVSGGLLLFLVWMEKKYPRLWVLQLLTLALFQWSSMVNGFTPLYLFFVGKEAYRFKDLHKSIAAAFAYIVVFATIRLTYDPFDLSHALMIWSDIMASMAVAVAVHFIVRFEREKHDLDRRYDFLAKHDALTGLVNFQECHIRLQELVNKRASLCFILIDCNDLKALNSDYGYEAGNRILLRTSQLLHERFPDAYFIARYGGDEFVVVSRVSNKTAGSMNDVMTGFTLEAKQSLGIEVTYGCVFFPEEAENKEMILTIAEKRVASMKRELWLRLEEDMLRSEKLRVVGELAAGMAHEIRNPITAVKGFLQISKENDYNIERWYDILMHEISRVSELTSELLQFSKPHMTKFRVESLPECIQRIVYLTESEALLKGHTLRVEILADPLYVRVDRDKMIQVLLNLVKNAFDAMQESGTVTIRLTRQKENALIEVIDTGRGIPASELPHIFLPFYTTKENGTGLGLSICHKIVEDQGGTLTVTSEEKKGTAFQLSLPLVQKHSE